MIVYTPYVLLPLASAALLAWIGAYARRFRSVPASLPFRVVLWLCALFSLIFALSLLAGPLALRLLLLQLVYLPGAFVAPAILVMAIEYTGHIAWVARKRLAALLIIPVITIILALTPALHPLFRHSPQVSAAGPLSVITFSRGPWYWVYYGYGSALTIASLLILIASLRDRSLHATDTALIILGVLVPFLADVLTVLRLTPIPSYVWTPLLFACTGVIYGLALLRGQIFVVARIARSCVMDYVDDLVIVLDVQGRIADFNRAAQAVCGLSHQLIGATPAALPAEWADLIGRCDSAPASKKEVAVGSGEQRRIYDLAVSTILHNANRPLGRLFILHDVTGRRRDADALRAANQTLQAKLEQIQLLQEQLREQATHDVITGLFNRRYMQEILDQGLAHAAHDFSPLSVLMIDIDHFKQLNDTHGHRAGDMVLQSTGALLRSHTRHMDTACRYGGEEFVVIMAATALETGMCRAEELRKAFADMCVAHGGDTLQGTISIGVAVFPEHGADSDSLLRAADQALYMAKATGRNRVCAADPHFAAAAKLLITS